jgi:diguanylate cyclase (GGDEF)-like protein
MRTSDDQATTKVEHSSTASIGVAMFVANDISEIEIMKHADEAMYQAKDAGRNSIRFYES